nr:uncharacterized protein y4hQ-like [Parasteatoda tepidariorum]
MTSASTSDIFQFKITLKGAQPLIWRRIQISKNATFEKFHLAVNKSMGWNESHVHEFRLKTKTDVIGPKDRSCFIDAMCWDNVLGKRNILDESKIKISTHFNKPKDSMVYVYDLGDRWTHSIVLEEILQSLPKKKYPVCLDGRRACPPDDCGGEPGFKDLLEILSNPRHPEFKEKKEWLCYIGKRNWKPEVFDVKSVKS